MATIPRMAVLVSRCAVRSISKPYRNPEPMKKNKPLPKLANGLMTGAVLLNTLALSSFADKELSSASADIGGRRDRIVKKRAGKKSRAVRIYPDIMKRTMHVISKDVNENPVDFYVFALDGTLLANHRLNPGDHVRIGDLPRGTFVYEVFDGDEMAEKGKLEIR